MKFASILLSANALSLLVRNLDQMKNSEEGKQLGNMIQQGYGVISRETNLTTQRKADQTAHEEEFETRLRENKVD